MELNARSIRPFIGSKNFQESKSFYLDLGFQESVLSKNLSYFYSAGFGFYLQDAYVEDWINNSMVFMEVDSVERFWNELVALKLTTKYPKTKIVPARELDWGKECFLHDPSGILWHFGEFI